MSPPHRERIPDNAPDRRVARSLVQGALFGALLFLSGASQPPKPTLYMARPWKAGAAISCYPGHGADNVSQAGFNPVPGHLSLQDCQHHCEFMAECDAFLMADTSDGATSDGAGDNCFLYRNIDATKCEIDPHKNMWLKPGVRRQYDDQWSWLSYASTNCFPGRGAELVIDDVLPRHLTLLECEGQCLATQGCEAVVWRETRSASDPNCHLRKAVRRSECLVDAASNLRVLQRYADPEPALTPWPTIASVFCSKAYGGVSLPDFDPVLGYLSLAQCQELCRERNECSAIVMVDVQDARANNCWLYRSIDLGECLTMADAAVWLKPRVRREDSEQWLSYAGLDCFPTMGAEYAVASVDTLEGDWDLKGCEHQCLMNIDCEAIVWQQNEYSSRRDCRLRRSVIPEDCEVHPAFSLRILNKAHQPSERATYPRHIGWKTLSVVGCHPGAGGDRIAADGFDPVVGQPSLESCELLCLMEPDCEAVIMGSDWQPGDPCSLHKSINLYRCHQQGTATLWFRPGHAPDDTAGWESFAGINCYPGAGALKAVDGQGAFEGKTVRECEKACEDEAACEAIVWDRALGWNSKCHLIRGVDLDQCESSPGFELRMRPPAAVKTFVRASLPAGGAQRFRRALAGLRQGPFDSFAARGIAVVAGFALVAGLVAKLVLVDRRCGPREVSVAVRPGATLSDGADTAVLMAERE